MEAKVSADRSLSGDRGRLGEEKAGRGENVNVGDDSVWLGEDTSPLMYSWWTAAAAAWGWGWEWEWEWEWDGL